LIIALYSKLPISSHEGLLSEISAGPWVSFWVTLVSLEFVGYWWHRLSHFVPWLWRLHAVHHSDTEVDATTALRHHPGEVLLGSFVNLGVIMFLGTQPITALGCSLLSLSMDAFTHGNLSLGGVGRWLRYLLVTPSFHRVHHSATLPYTNRNFSNNFPLFDYLFGTAVCWSRQQQMTMPLGLEYFRERRAVGLDRLLLQPLLPHEIPKKGEVLREQVRTGKNT
jgi:sterol desaturase/sphingolipid hydroxylase (fatty acid hydroxylase superfamily)